VPNRYTPGSFTKNFSWNKSYKRLHTAIRNAFSPDRAPVPRDIWRERSDIQDADLELIPLNFFLYSMHGLNDDFVVVDRLVDRAFVAYDSDFAKLALFAFHLATSGTWRYSKWPSGKVAGWANDFVKGVAWSAGRWSSAAMSKQSLKTFLEEAIDGKSITKVRTNYRFMLKSAGILVDDQVQPTNLRAPWLTDATMLFWDRQIFSGELHRSSSPKDFEVAFFRNEIHKLLACTAEEGRTIALSSYRRYATELMPRRLEQLEHLRDLLAA